MKSFNVLDQHLAINQNYFLEASAGTGKTFAIQNILTRLLIAGEHPLSLDQILIVTFTRAATSDLKKRIRQTIESSLSFLDFYLKNNLFPEDTFDYLKALADNGEKGVSLAKKRLEEALFMFDQAAIFTIHGFCSRMLRQHALDCDLGLHANSNENPLSQSKLKSLIKDFFRTEIHLEKYSTEQLAILLKKDPDQNLLLKTVQSAPCATNLKTFQQHYQEFVAVMKELKNRYQLSSSLLLEDFQKQYLHFKNYKSTVSKAEILKKIESFVKLLDMTDWSAQDFDILLSDGLVWSAALDPSLLKKNAPKTFQLNYNDFTEALDPLKQIVHEASDFLLLLTRLAADFQKYLTKYKKEEEFIEPDDLLNQMCSAIENPSFRSCLQDHFKVVIIDEFQDTDPLQWTIFERLFCSEDDSWKGHLYLVGDPKQSIYAFRQADIYTYRKAKKALGESAHYSLGTNFRSQPHLVKALNALFSAEHMPNLFPLPKEGESLSYEKVQTRSKDFEDTFCDGRGAIHFFIHNLHTQKVEKLTDLEENSFFPFILHEIQSLKQKNDFHFRDFAILVRDRFQAARLMRYLSTYEIPFFNQRGSSLFDSPILPALIDLFKMLLEPNKLSHIKAFLGSILGGWPIDDLLDSTKIEKRIPLVYLLKSSLISKPFGLFFQEFLSSCWKEGVTIQEQLLKLKDGKKLLKELTQFGHLILSEYGKSWTQPQMLISFLDELVLWDENDDPRLKQWIDTEQDGVKILSLHSSKGLEFKIVFALGLINPIKRGDSLLLIEERGKKIARPSLSDAEERHYLEEVDAEKMRQLYVTMTRAKERLYLPALLIQKGNIKWGEASPMDLFLARLGRPILTYEELYQTLNNEEHQLIDWIEKKGKEQGITYSFTVNAPCVIKEDNQDKSNLVSPKIPRISAPPLYMSSFSNMSSSSYFSLDTIPPHDFSASEQTPHTLPADANTGLLLHRILEKIPFNIGEDEIIPFIQAQIDLDKWIPWISTIKTLIQNVLKVNLGSFSLSELSENSFYKEMPFIFPYKGPLIEGTSFSNGMINGVIDLIFQYNDLYYILDWKSNWLGPNIDAYEPDSLKSVMDQHQYFLQATLYTEALKRYLKVVETRPFDQCFGGVFYLFLRGIEIDKKNGIYHFFPKPIS